MKAFRSLLFWCHLCTGVVVGLLVLLMSVTGVLLTYQKQMTAWADTRGLNGSPPQAGAVRLPVDTLLARLAMSHPGTPSTVVWRNQPDAPVAVAFGLERTLFLNAYTGAVLGEGSAAMRRVFLIATEWHRYLGRYGDQRPLGKSITGAANLGFLLLILSGLYLWLPRNWSPAAVRNVALFRRGLSGKARDFNWHNVIGLWSFVPLFLIVLSGVVISYPWASRLVLRVAGETPPPPAAPPGAARPALAATASTPTTLTAPPALEPLVAAARDKRPGWKILTLQVPPADPEVTRAVFTVDEGTGGQPQARATLTYDRTTGAELKWEPFSSGTPGRRLRTILRFTHTGEVLGIVGQTIAGLVSLGATLLVWTGLWLAWRRFRSWQGRGAAARTVA